MSTRTDAWPANDLMVALNVLALYAVSAVLLVAFYIQFSLNNLPCPLCLLQRIAFTMMAVGLIFNIVFGPRARGYGLILLAASAGGVISVRQILLHIAPGDPGYGAPVFGLHDYTWVAIVFAVAIVTTGFILLFDRHLAPSAIPRAVGAGAVGAIWLAVGVTVLNAGFALIECGFAVCPDNPVSYVLWPSL